MKIQEQISPWKVTQRMQTKDFQQENQFSLPKMNLHMRRSSLQQQNMTNSPFASTADLRSSNSTLRLTKINSLRNSQIGKKLADKKESLMNVHQNGGFKPTPPLVTAKKTYKYHEIMGKSNDVYGRQSTPMIKQRMQMLLKSYELPELNQNYLKSMANQRTIQVKAEKRETAKTNIQFIYRSEPKAKKSMENSPAKQAKAHILDNLLYQWEC